MHRLALALGLVGATAAIVAAADVPISARRLLLRDVGGYATLVFVSRDGAIAPPVSGSPDDPTTGIPGGAVIELFSASGDVARMLVPRGPGWHEGRTSYRYRNRESPSGAHVVRAVRLRNDRIALTARSSGLPLHDPLGDVAVRVTFGTTRLCTIFGGEGVRADGDGRFLAYGGVAPADCHDATLTPPVLPISLPIAFPASVLASCTPGGVVAASIPDPLGEAYWVTATGTLGALDVLPTECQGGGRPFDAQVGDAIPIVNGQITPLLVAVASCLDASPPRDLFWIPIIGDVPPGTAAGTIEAFAIARIVQVVLVGPERRVDLEIACD